jgi:hypothetical protein
VISATRELLAPREDVWKVVAEPYHLPDWWPAYSGVQPDRRGLAEGARWEVVRSRTPGFVRRPRGSALILIRRVDVGRELRWFDLAQQIEAGVRLEEAGSGRTRATAFVEGSGWRLLAEGARGLPKQAVTRLYDLCQTAATL